MGMRGCRCLVQRVWASHKPQCGESRGVLPLQGMPGVGICFHSYNGDAIRELPAPQPGEVPGGAGGEGILPLCFPSKQPLWPH